MAEVLRTAPVFRKLSPDDRVRVAAHASVRTYPRGSVIFSEGEPAETFYMVTSGRVKVFKMTPAGKDVILRCGPIDALGTVVWNSRGQCGVHFDEPVGGQDLVALRAVAVATEQAGMTPEELQAMADWANGLAR